MQVRLGKHASKFHWVRLASYQMLAMAVLSDLWLAADVARVTAAGAPVDSLWPGHGCALSAVHFYAFMRLKHFRAFLCFYASGAF